MKNRMDFLRASGRLSRPVRWFFLLIKYGVWALPIWLVIFLLNENQLILPSVTMTYLPDHPQNALSVSHNGVMAVWNENQKLEWRVTQDEISIQARVPPRTKQLTLKGELHNVNQQVIALTAQGWPTGTQTKLIRAVPLDVLGWPYAQDGPLTLWRRPSSENSGTPSTQEFFDHLPDPRKIGVVDMDPFLFDVQAAPPVSPTPITLETTIRGSHELYVYAQAGQRLGIVIDKVDLNRVEGTDPVYISIRNPQVKNQPLGFLKQVATIEDDGNVSDDNRRGEPQTLSIEWDADQSGLYLVDLSTTEDVVFTKIESSTAQIGFRDHIFFAEGPAYGPDQHFQSLHVITRGSYLTAVPKHAQGYQDIIIRDAKLKLREVKKPQTIEDLDGVTRFTIDRGDLVVQSDGILTLEPGIEIPVQPVHRLDLNAFVVPEEVEYILANYHPQSPYGTVTFSETFDATNVLNPTRDVAFTLETPGLRIQNRVLVLRKLSLELRRGSLDIWGALRRKLNTSP